MTQQILFKSEDQSLQTFENFYAANNHHLVCALKELLQQQKQFGCLYLYGQRGAGKTHLLRSAVQALGKPEAYLDLKFDIDRIKQLSTHTCLLALDNLEVAVDQEAELMMTFETLKQNSGILLFSSVFPPSAQDFRLEDLKSRLASSQVFEIRSLSDEDKVRALKFRASLRGFELSDEVVNYVISRYPRDFNTLFDLLNIIDNASLTRQRKITVPFIKSLEKSGI